MRFKKVQSHHFLYWENLVAALGKVLLMRLKNRAWVLSLRLKFFVPHLRHCAKTQ